MGGIGVKNDPASLVGIFGNMDDITVSAAGAFTAEASRLSGGLEERRLGRHDAAHGCLVREEGSSVVAAQIDGNYPIALARISELQQACEAK